MRGISLVVEIHLESGMRTIIFHHHGGIIIEAGFRGIATSQQRLAVFQQISGHVLGQCFLLPCEEAVISPQSKAAIAIITEKSLVVGCYRVTASRTLANSLSHILSCRSLPNRRFRRG